MVEHEDQFLTVAEAAARLKVTRHTIYRWIGEGRLPAIRYSPRVLRVRQSDLERYGQGHSLTAVRERGVAYEARSGDDAELEEQREEARQLMERYRELSRRRRRPGEPPRGSWEALRRHVGVITKEEGEELWRIIKEDRDLSSHDADFSFDETS